jgi:hypothetical protein
MRKLALFSAWLLATVAVSSVTYQVLAAADSGVRDAPRTAVVVASGLEPPVAAVGASASDSSNTTSITPYTSDPVTPDGSSTTHGLLAGTSPAPRPDDNDGAGGSLVNPASTTTTTTMPPPGASTVPPAPATTSATVSEAWKTTTITSPGGSLTVSYRTGEVRYEVAVPAAGFELDIESTGPDVRVEFEGEDEGWEIRARWHDGAFSPEVKET